MSASKNGQLKHYYKRKQEAIELLGGKCVVCGTTENLEFDHIDPTTKVFSISKVLRLSRERYLEELKKCQLLCTTHHKDKTRKEYLSKRTHGKQFLAIRLLCDCEICTSFREEYNAKRREKRAGNRKKKTRQHGTRAMYLRGCSCDPCNDANNKYMREYKRRRKGA